MKKLIIPKKYDDFIIRRFSNMLYKYAMSIAENEDFGCAIKQGIIDNGLKPFGV